MFLPEKQPERTGSKKGSLQGTGPRSGKARPLGSSRGSLPAKGGGAFHCHSFGWKSPYPSPRPRPGDQCLSKAVLGLTSSVQSAEGESQQPAHLDVHGKRAYQVSGKP